MNYKAMSPCKIFPSTKKKWLVLSNCQAYGLANSLSILSPELEATGLDLLTASERESEILSSLSEYERVIVSPRVEHMLNSEITSSEKTFRVPHLLFRAFHPDLTYLNIDGRVHFTSAISFAAFSSGFTFEQTLGLFNKEMFAALGYLNSWDTEKETLLASFEQCGLNLEKEFVKWSRSGCFMHMPNHPHIRCLLDVAKVLLRKFEVEWSSDVDLIPDDNLVKGPVYPVYPEIGDVIGVDGSYLYKYPGAYRVAHFGEFLRARFTEYENAKSISAAPGFDEQLSHVRAVVREVR